MKKFLSILFCLCLCAALAGCGAQYEDTNGPDDFSLQTITDENIIQRNVGASGLTYTESNFAGIIQSTEYSAKNFNGVEELYQTNFLLPSDFSVYIGHMNVKSGNFRLVAINNDEIIFDFPLDAFGETFWFEDIKGSFAVHVVGESAAFEFYIDIPE